MQGFDGSTDSTDHLVKWISAANHSSVERYAESLGLVGYSIDEADVPADCDTVDGVDVVLAQDGTVAVLAPYCNPFYWKTAHLPI